MKEALKIVNDQLQKSKIDDQDAKTVSYPVNPAENLV